MRSVDARSGRVRHGQPYGQLVVDRLDPGRGPGDPLGLFGLRPRIHLAGEDHAAAVHFGADARRGESPAPSERGCVSVHDSKVTLNGNVRSWAERKAAEQAAWAAPGVTEVDDRLAIVP